MDLLDTIIFIDFWNLQLNIIEQVGKEYRLDWRELSPFLLREASKLLQKELHFRGANVYLSYDPRTAKGKGLHNWSVNVLDRFPGLRVIAKERRRKSPPACPICHQVVQTCPHCGGRMTGTIEKGVDTAIVTDMISLAWEKSWEVAILVTSDRDYIPVVEFLTNRGLRIINSYFPPKGVHLARKCWASIDLIPHLASLSR